MDMARRAVSMADVSLSAAMAAVADMVERAMMARTLLIEVVLMREA
jgi:hypothetical protein